VHVDHGSPIIDDGGLLALTIAVMATPRSTRSRQPTATAMMDRVVDRLGLNREKLKPAFDMAKEMDDLDQSSLTWTHRPGVERAGSHDEGFCCRG
jgi:hypothetical protein